MGTAGEGLAAAGDLALPAQTPDHVVIDGQGVYVRTLCVAETQTDVDKEEPEAKGQDDPGRGHRGAHRLLHCAHYGKGEGGGSESPACRE